MYPNFDLSPAHLEADDRYRLAMRILEERLGRDVDPRTPEGSTRILRECPELAGDLNVFRCACGCDRPGSIVFEHTRWAPEHVERRPVTISGMGDGSELSILGRFYRLEDEQGRDVPSWGLVWRLRT